MWICCHCYLLRCCHCYLLRFLLVRQAVFDIYWRGDYDKCLKTDRLKNKFYFG